VEKVRPVEPGPEAATRIHASGDRDGDLSNEDGFPRISVIAVVSMGLPFLSLLLLLSGTVYDLLPRGDWAALALVLLPTAVVLGIVALSGIKRSSGMLRGRGFAIVGIVLGVAGTVLLGGMLLLFWSILRCFGGC
jgi:hypothetical protein